MKKADIIREYERLLKELGVPASDVVLNSGAALVIYGVRKETSDLDVDVTEEIFERYRKTHPLSRFGNTLVIKYDSIIDLHYTGTDNGIVTIDGVSVPTIADLIKFKMYLARHPYRDANKVSQDMFDIIALQHMRDKVG